MPLRSTTTTSPIPAGTPVSIFAPTLTPRPTAPTRDFDGTVKGDGSSVLVRRAPELNAEAIGVCPDRARVHVGNLTADGQWFDLGWDSSNPPSTCYSVGGHERDGRLVAYISAALITPPTAQTVPGSSGTAVVGASGTAAALTGSPVPLATEEASAPTARPTVATARPPTRTPLPFALTAGTPTCAATGGQFLIRWTVTDPNRLLAGLDMSVTAPSGQTLPAVTRSDADGNAVGTVLVSAAGSYDLMGTITNTDGSVARATSSVSCAGAAPAQAPTATVAEPTPTTAPVPTVEPTATTQPTERPPVFLGTAIVPPARTLTPES